MIANAHMYKNTLMITAHVYQNILMLEAGMMLGRDCEDAVRKLERGWKGKDAVRMLEGCWTEAGRQPNMTIHKHTYTHAHMCVYIDINGHIYIYICSVQT